MRRGKLTAEDILAILEQGNQSDIELAGLGDRLREIGITRERLASSSALAGSFIQELKDSHRRPHRDDEGVWHPGLRVDIDDEDTRRRSIDWEVLSCWSEDENRFAAYARAHRNCTALPERLTEDEPDYASELRMRPEVGAMQFAGEEADDLRDDLVKTLA